MDPGPATDAAVFLLSPKPVLENVAASNKEKTGPVMQKTAHGMYSTVGTPRVVAIYNADTVQGMSGSTIVTESSSERDRFSGASPWSRYGF
jgi:hypothetical protein